MLVYLNLAFHCFHLPERSTHLTSTLNFIKTPFPITRGYLKKKNRHREVDLLMQGMSVLGDIKIDDQYMPTVEPDKLKICDVKPKIDFGELKTCDDELKPKIEPEICETPKRGRKRRYKKRNLMKQIKKETKAKVSRDSDSSDKDKTAKKYLCSICNIKKYKYKRNKLRHEKYECVTGPQFTCGECGKRYSQKKTLVMHISLKHINVKLENA